MNVQLIVLKHFQRQYLRLFQDKFTFAEKNRTSLFIPTLHPYPYCFSSSLDLF